MSTLRILMPQLLTACKDNTQAIYEASWLLKLHIRRSQTLSPDDIQYLQNFGNPLIYMPGALSAPTQDLRKYIKQYVELIVNVFLQWSSAQDIQEQFAALFREAENYPWVPGLALALLAECTWLEIQHDRSQRKNPHANISILTRILNDLYKMDNTVEARHLEQAFQIAIVSREVKPIGLSKPSYPIHGVVPYSISHIPR
jgi:hypothetical protein